MSKNKFRILLVIIVVVSGSIFLYVSFTPVLFISLAGYTILKNKVCAIRNPYLIDRSITQKNLVIREIEESFKAIEAAGGLKYDRQYTDDRCESSDTTFMSSPECSKYCAYRVGRVYKVEGDNVTNEFLKFEKAIINSGWIPEGRTIQSAVDNFKSQYAPAKDPIVSYGGGPPNYSKDAQLLDMGYEWSRKTYEIKPPYTIILEIRKVYFKN